MQPSPIERRIRFERRVKLRKVERKDADLVAAPAKLRDDIARQKFGIAPRDVYVRVRNVQKSVDDALEIRNKLDLVQENIIRVVVLDLRLYKSVELVGILQVFIAIIFERDANDMIGGDAIPQKMVVKQYKKQVRFAAPANPRDNLNQPVMLVINELLQVKISCDLHSYPRFVFLFIIAKNMLEVKRLLRIFA